MPEGIDDHFGPELSSFLLMQYHQGSRPSPGWRRCFGWPRCWARWAWRSPSPSRTARNQRTVSWFFGDPRAAWRIRFTLDGPSEKGNIIGQFSRIDAGDPYVDHHAFFRMKNERAELNHFSFEMQDIDGVCIGHGYLDSLNKNVIYGQVNIQYQSHGAAEIAGS